MIIFFFKERPKARISSPLVLLAVNDFSFRNVNLNFLQLILRVTKFDVKYPFLFFLYGLRVDIGCYMNFIR